MDASFILEDITFVPGGFTQHIRTIPGLHQQRPIDWNRFDEICEQKAAGTGSWIFEAPEFGAWLDGPESSRLLWLNGGPGTGKTFLTSTIIEFLNQRTSEGAVVLFVYLDDHSGSSDGGLRTLSREWNLFKLLSRMLREMDYAFSALFDTETWEGIRDERNPRRLLATLVEAFTRWPHPIYIVLDGLEDYSLRVERVERLLGQLNSLPGNVRILVTSRRAVGFAGLLGDVGAVSMGVQPTTEDIERYIHHRVSRDSSLAKHLPMEKEIATKIMEMMQGTMSYPLACHLLNAIGDDDNIKTPGNLRAALGKLPENQEAIWHHTLYLIGQQDEVRASDARKVLTWLIAGTIPPDDLQFAMLVAPGRANPRQHFQPGIETYLVDICYGLVEITVEDDEIMEVEDDGEDGMEAEDDNENEEEEGMEVGDDEEDEEDEEDDGYSRIVVDFVDPKLREFLRKYVKDAEAVMTTTFIDFLSDPDRRFTLSHCRSHNLTEDDVKADEKWFEFLDPWWGAHAGVQEDLIITDLYNYLKDDDRAGFLLMVVSNVPDGPAPYSIWAAVRFGLFLTLLELLRNGVVWVPDADLDAKLEGRTFLHIAAEFGHPEDFEPYLTPDNQTNLDITDDSGRTPLSYAAGTGGLDIVVALLSTGRVNINARDEEGRTPLSHAVELREVDSNDTREAQINIVDLLLKQQGHHLNINDQDDSERTVLSYAADLDCDEESQMRLVGRLLEVPGIDRLLPDANGISPVGYASSRGKTGVVSLLLGHTVQPPFMSSWLASSLE